MIESRVVRGGAWNNNQDNARADYRNDNNPDNRNNNIGFRVVCSSHIRLQPFDLKKVPACPQGYGSGDAEEGWWMARARPVRTPPVATGVPASGIYKSRAPFG